MEGIKKYSSFCIYAYCLLFSFVSRVNCLSTFNKEDLIGFNQPLVIYDSSQEESYFGYSLAALKSSNRQKWASILYIGAPKGNYTSRKDIIEPGKIFECNINDESVLCKIQEEIESITENVSGGYCAQGISSYSEKMWMGGTISVSSESGLLVTCGNRRQTKGTDTRISGICFRLGEDSSRRPKADKLDPPLAIKDQLQQRQIGQHRVSEHLWQYGQFGFSSLLSETGKLLIGIPGHYHWNGAVGVFDQDSHLSCPTNDNFKNNLFRYPPSEEKRFGSASYLGYALTSGDYYAVNHIVYAAGSPRGGLLENGFYVTGLVSVFGSIIPKILRGPQQLGSYFGSVLASVDINGDGRDDLIVGAPFYKLQQSSESFDEGCVFIFSTKGFETLQSVDTLCPNQDPRGMFGSAIANIGDINQDNVEDMAISAPMAASGVGVVYIYFGIGSSGNSHTKLDQPLRYVASAESGIKGFGSSLYGKIDIDGNGTPDLIVGSFTSKKVAVVRTRPKLEIILEFQNRIQKFKRNSTEFTLSPCIKIQRTPQYNGGRLKIWVEVTSDSDKAENFERFIFKETNERVLLFNVDAGGLQCTPRTVIVNLKKRLEADDSKEIKFEWKLYYNETKDLIKTLDVQTYDLADSLDLKVSVPGQKEFCAYCPPPTSFQQSSSIPVEKDDCGGRTCLSKLNVKIKMTNDRGDQMPNFTIGLNEHRTLDVLLENDDQTAYSPTINLTVKSSNAIIQYLSKAIVFPTEKSISCLSGSEAQRQEQLKYNIVVISCRSNVPLHKDSRVNFKFQMSFNEINVYAMPENEEINLEVKAYPEDHQNQVSKPARLDIKLVSDVQLKIFGDMQEQEYFLNFKSWDHQIFINKYIISNEGISPLNSVRLRFKIPVKRRYQRKNETFFEIEEPNQQEINCDSTVPFARFNLEKSTGSSTRNSQVTPFVSRKRRDTKAEIDNPASSKSKQPYVQGNQMEIGCGPNSNWKCAILNCNVTRPLYKSRPLTIRFRLKALTNRLTKIILPDIEGVVVKTDGGAKIFEKSEQQNATAITELRIIKDDGLPALLLFGSAIAGLILFLLITFGLFKCGFFRRKTKENLRAIKARAEEEAILAQQFPMPSDDQEDDENADR